MTVFFSTHVHRSLLLLSWKWPNLARHFAERHLGRGRLGVGSRKLILTAKETTVSPVPGPGLSCTSKSPAHNSGHFLLLSSVSLAPSVRVGQYFPTVSYALFC